MKCLPENGFNSEKGGSERVAATLLIRAMVGFQGFGDAGITRPSMQGGFAPYFHQQHIDDNILDLWP